METQDRTEAVTHARHVQIWFHSPSIRGVQFDRCPHQGHWQWGVSVVTLTVENQMDLLGIPCVSLLHGRLRQVEYQAI